jgi:hypothetical protein
MECDLLTFVAVGSPEVIKTNNMSIKTDKAILIAK